MDPATAFQLACGAIQLIDFGLKTTKTFHEIYKNDSSLSDRNEHLQQEAQRLQNHVSALSSKLNASSQITNGLSPDQKRLQRVVRECAELDETLLQKLEGLSLSGKKRKRDIPGLWIKASREGNNIKNIQSRLQSCHQQLDSELLANVCTGIDVNNEQQRDILQQVDFSQVQMTNLFQTMGDSFRQSVRDLRIALFNELNETKNSIIDVDQRNVARHELQKLLDSLHFDDLDTRQETLQEAYQSTFEWIFNRESSAVRPWSNFARWLEHGEGIYWVNGKAGSGKSTLMNYIVESSMLEELLSIWAAHKQLIVPKFFFWRAGTPLQRSINGMLRSLLFQLISNQPAFASLIPPKIKNAPVWTDTRLINVLSSLFEQTHLNIKICLVIDGVDEFDGDPDSQAFLLELMKNVSSNLNVKLVVSSRPEPSLLEAFENCQGLRLQDLTQRDMRTYIEGKLLSEPRMRKHLATSNDAVEQLLNKICNKADGVFLWVRLAVQDLITGLRARDTLALLQERLKLLDRSLDGLFLQLLKRIQPVYREKAASCIRYLSECDEYAMLVPVAFALHPEFTHNMHRVFDSSSITNEDVTWLSEEINDIVMILLTQSASLLEVNFDKQLAMDEHRTFSVLPDINHLPAHTKSSTASFAIICLQCHWNTSVSFIHRSAIEFLAENLEAKMFLDECRTSKDVTSMRIEAWIGAARTNLFILSATDAIRLSGWKPYNEVSVMHAVDTNVQDIIHATICRRQSCHGPDLRTLIDEINAWFCRDVQRIRRFIQHEFNSLVARFRYPMSIIFPHAAFIDPAHLIMNYMIGFEDPSWALDNLSSDYQTSANYFFVSYMMRFLAQEQSCLVVEHSLELINQLLSLGVKPNERLHGRGEAQCSLPFEFFTAWELFIFHLSHLLRTWGSDWRQDDSTALDTILQSINIFLDRGADPSATLFCPNYNGDYAPYPYRIDLRFSALWVVDTYLRDRPGSDRLIKRMKEHGATSILELDGLRRSDLGEARPVAQHQQAVLRRALERWAQVTHNAVYVIGELRALLDGIWNETSHLERSVDDHFKGKIETGQ